MKSKALSIVVLLLTVVLFGLLFVNQRQEQRQTAYMQQLQKEAMPYEQEINDIRLELAQKQRAINTKEDTSGILFGFVPASVDDFTEIDKLAAEHSITPVIFLDCSQEKEQLAQILEKAVAKDYEVVLAGLQIDESILQTADEMKDLLAQMDDTKSPAFLLRNNVNTEETRNLLNEHGYTELILYDASLQAGMQENGKPYICYGFFKQPVYYAYYISQVVTAHTMMLASFSFSTIQNGTLQISDVERFMTLADDRKAANELRYVDLNSAFQAVADQNQPALLLRQNLHHCMKCFLLNDFLQHIDRAVCNLAPIFRHSMIRNAHITLTCSLAFPLGFFHFPFTLKQCADMPLAVFKVFLLDHIASPRRCIIGIIPTAVVNVKHGVSLSGREQNVAALIDRQMTAMLKFFTQKNPTFFQKHLWRGYALGMYRCFYHFLDLFQCKHFVHLSAFRLRVN